MSILKYKKKIFAMIILIFSLVIIGLWIRHNRICNGSFKVSSDLPYYMAFGRGSGLRGYDSIEIDERGEAKFYRHPSWEMASMRLSAQTLVDIANIIDNLKITSMDNYYDGRLIDGSQWIFWLKQGDNEKSIYFNNSFPESIKEFAKKLDSELLKNAFDSIQWKSLGRSDFDTEQFSNFKHFRKFEY